MIIEWNVYFLITWVVRFDDGTTPWHVIDRTCATADRQPCGVATSMRVRALACRRKTCTIYRPCMKVPTNVITSPHPPTQPTPPDALRTLENMYYRPCVTWKMHKETKIMQTSLLPKMSKIRYVEKMTIPRTQNDPPRKEKWNAVIPTLHMSAIPLGEMRKCALCGSRVRAWYLLVRNPY